MAFFRRCARLVRIDYAPSQRFNKLLRHLVVRKPGIAETIVMFSLPIGSVQARSKSLAMRDSASRSLRARFLAQSVRATHEKAPMRASRIGAF